MFKLLNKIYIIGALCVAATPAFARVCFLPDGNCEAGKATYSPVNNITGCEYKDENAAKNGLGECQEYYKSGMCYYRRCKMSEKECLEAAHASIHKWITQNYHKIDILRPGLGLKSNVINGTGTVVTPGITVNPVLRVTKQKCVVCKDGCWKLEKSAYGPDTEHTCKEMGYKTKENCTAEYVKFTPISLIDKNGERCGKCENLACMEMGGLKTEGSCAAGEKFVYANKIDGFNNKCGTCEAVAVPLITIKITNKSDTKFDKTENSANGLVMTKTTSTTTTSFTTTTSDNSTHKVQLRFTQIDTEFSTPNSGKVDNGLISGGGNVNILKEKSVANTSNISNNASANNPRTITIGENESATTSHSQEIKRFLIGDSTAEATSSCLMTLIIDSKEVQSFAYQGDNLWCNELCKNFADLNYDKVYSYDEYNVKFENSSEQIITKNTCATWKLKTETEANCGAGEIFQQDTTHKTDDNGDKCGTCVKDNSQCYGTANIYLAYYSGWPDDKSILKGFQSIELGFKSADKVAKLEYKSGISQTSVTLDGNHTYYNAVEPTYSKAGTKCYYKVITKEEYEKTTGLTLKATNSIWNLSFYGSVWQAWPSNNVVNCKGDWVAIMACVTNHGERDLNQNSYCRDYDSNYGSCYGDAKGGTDLPSEIKGASSDQKSCCVKFGTR